MFFCKECGYESSKWLGKCPACQSWDTFKEAPAERSKSKTTTVSPKRELLSNIVYTSSNRILTNIREFDIVLGGGIIDNMVVLIGGEPGIGKSTLMLQVASSVAESGKKVLYVSGEESPKQIKQRSDRMNIPDDSLYLLCSNVAEEILAELENDEYELLIIDSIQAVSCENQNGIPGSFSQIREAAILFTRVAKQKNIRVFIIGHITKEGTVAGPKLIEHLVDTVLYFEGDINNHLKILKATKNRFGSTNEIGVFNMTEKGLTEVQNPSLQFIEDSALSAGSAISCVIEGTRSFLIEVQALTSQAVYGNAQRIALGFDQKKLSLLLAIIEKKLALNMRQFDTYVNILGGIKVNDPALDLAIVAAIISGYENKALPLKTVFIGELGLNGEVRPVSLIEKRINEAAKLGFDKIVVPHSAKSKTHKITPIKRIEEIYPILFNN